MRPVLGLSALIVLLATGPVQAGNTSSNSSSNSSNGIHTRIDTLVSDDGRGRRFNERRFRRYDDFRGRYGYRDRYRYRGEGFRGRGYGSRRGRDDDDD